MVRRIDTQAVIDSVRLEEQASDVATPASGFGALYGKQDGALYYIGDDGIVRPGGIGEGALVYNSTTQSIPSGVITTLTFDSETYDKNGYHSTVTNTSRLTVPSNGVYLISSYVEFAANSTGVRYLSIKLDGTTNIGVQSLAPANAIPTRLVVSSIYELTASQYVETQAYQTVGVNLNASAFGFAIARIG